MWFVGSSNVSRRRYLNILCWIPTVFVWKHLVQERRTMKPCLWPPCGNSSLTIHLFAILIIQKYNYWKDNIRTNFCTLPVGYKLLPTLYVISHAITLTVLKFSKVLISWMTSESWPGTELPTETVSVKEAISCLLNGKLINTNSTITCMFDDSFCVEYNDRQQQRWKKWTWPILIRCRRHLFDGLST